MRVLHFLDMLSRGGAETLALDICRTAHMNNLDIVLATANGGALEEDFQKSGVPFYKLGRKLPIDPFLISQLRKLIIEEKIDVVQGYQAVENLHLYLATRGLRHVKNVFACHGHLGKKRNQFAANLLIPRVDANIVVSEALRRVLKEEDGLDTNNNFRVLYNGVDEARLKPTGKDVRTELHIPPNVCIITMVGNFYAAKRKDQFTLCRAMKIVAEKHPETRCLIVGRAYEDAVHKLQECEKFVTDNGISKNVIFTGARMDVPDILAATDIFVLSTFHEGFPIVNCEAMFAGVPTVLSDIGPNVESAKGGEYAVLFETENEVDLADKLIELIENPEKRSVLSNKAYAYMRSDFSIAAHIERLKKLYSELLSK